MEVGKVVVGAEAAEYVVVWWWDKLLEGVCRVDWSLIAVYRDGESLRLDEAVAGSPTELSTISRTWDIAVFVGKCDQFHSFRAVCAVATSTMGSEVCERLAQIAAQIQ